MRYGQLSHIAQGCYKAVSISFPVTGYIQSCGKVSRGNWASWQNNAKRSSSREGTKPQSTRRRTLRTAGFWRHIPSMDILGVFNCGCTRLVSFDTFKDGSLVAKQVELTALFTMQLSTRAHYIDATWLSRRLKPPVIRLFAEWLFSDWQ